MADGGYLAALSAYFGFGGRRRRVANRRSAAVPAAALAAVLIVPGPLAAQAPSAFTETYGDWVVRCAIEETGDGGSIRRCSMEQRFVVRDDATGDQRLLLSVVLVANDGGVEAEVLAPFGLLLQSGLRLIADDGPATTLGFETCYIQGCIARGALDDTILAAFRAGEALHIEADQGSEEPFRLDGSLRGFSAASDRLQGESR